MRERRNIKMCRTPKEEKLKKIAKDNSKLIDKVIVYINTELNIELYRDISNIKNIKESNYKKTTAFYKQTILRLLNKIEFYSMKERLLMLDIEKGQKLLNYKKSLTVTSVAYGGSEAGFNNGYKPNTQEKVLIEVDEERKKQEKRLLNYDLFMKSFEANKKMIKDFVELAPNVNAAEIIIRHFIYGQKFSEISKAMSYEKESLYVIWQRAVDELTTILELSL